MQKISRYSKFSFDESSYKKINAKLQEMLKNDNLYILRDYLYYSIGIIDYRIAFLNLNKNTIIDYLKSRAEYSAILQLIEKQEKSFDNKLRAFSLKDGDTVLPALVNHKLDKTASRTLIGINLNGHSILIPDKLYHGTQKDFSRKIGKPDKSKFFPSRDGMIYYAFEKSTAERYAYRSSDNGRIIELDITGDMADMFMMINDTSGGAPFIYEDDFYEMSKNKSIRFIIGEVSRSDVMDITYFADFVDTRNARMQSNIDRYGLQLPSEDEDFSLYLKSIESKIEKEI